MQGALRRRWLVAAAWGLAVMAVLLSPLRAFLDQRALAAALQPLGPWGPLAFVLLYAAAMVLGLPTLPFTVAAGPLFGLLSGSLWALLGATAGAMGAFSLSRWLLHGWVEARFGRHPALARFRRGIADRGLWFVLAVRLVPVTPFNIENLLFGLTPLTWSTYLLGTVVGILPGTVAYVWLGIAGAEALSAGRVQGLLAAATLVLALALLPWWLMRRHTAASAPRLPLPADHDQ